MAMTRAEAIGLLVQRDLAQLTSARREALLQDWWTIDADDPEYAALPDALKGALARDEGPDDPDAAVYEPLLRMSLREAYKGVLNSYLQRQITTLGRNEVVMGEVEPLESCPCCGYRTLDERGGYDICPVCFWEDDGTSELDRHSGPNHMTLRAARENFQRLGAACEEASRHVLPDGKQRYVASKQASLEDVIECVRALDGGSIARDGATAQFLEIRRSADGVTVSGNREGLIYLARLILEVANKGFAGAHQHFDAASDLDHCDVPLVIAFKPADWD